MSVTDRPVVTVRDLGNLPLVLRVEQVAEILGLGRTATYEAVRRGDIRSVTLGRRRLVPRSALAELLGEDVRPLPAARE